MKTQRYRGTKLLAAIERKSRSKMSPMAIDAGERRMRQWLLAHQSVSRAGPTANAGIPANVGPYLAISREAGAGGSRIARMVGEMVGWEVFDRELLERMAERYHTFSAALELVEETDNNWIPGIFGRWIDLGSVRQTQYMFRLSRAVFMAARAGRVIFVGRGAQLLLPHQGGVSVRLIASLAYRVQQIVERRHLSFDEAHDYVEKTDARRQEFTRQHFHHDITDLHLFDMTINVEKFGPQRTAHLIAGALASRFGVQGSP
ncbi:MAG: AAA family ATPase [Thermoguttaceae bacterium]